MDVNSEGLETMWKLRVFLVVLALVGLGAVCIYYFETIYAFVVVPVVIAVREVFVRLAEVLLRMGFRRTAITILLIALPISLRRKSKLKLRSLKKRATLYHRYGRRRWNKMPLTARIVVSLVCFTLVCIAAGFSGLVLFLISLLPLKFEFLSVVGNWLRGRILPFFARVAAANGLSRFFPTVWGTIPARIRLWVVPRYKKLWSWTIRRMIKRRQLMGRRASIVEASKAYQITIPLRSQRWD